MFYGFNSLLLQYLEIDPKNNQDTIIKNKKASEHSMFRKVFIAIYSESL